MESEREQAAEPPNEAVRVGDRLAWLAVGVGLALRVWEYSSLRKLYMDEQALLSNLVDVPIFEFGRVLSQDQLAPPGFLVVERLILRSPLNHLAAGRLFPLLCGLASMLLVVPLARRYVDAWSVPIAAWILALADHLIYYSAEIKQYSCDLALSMAALMLAVPRDARGPSTKRIAALALLGVVAPWFSFPVVFVLAAVGFHWIGARAIAKDRRGAATAAGVCLLWLINFGGCFAVSHMIVSKRDFLWVWWNFAFLPIPPHSVHDARFVAETLANVFINPGSLLTPFSLLVTAGLACGLALIGCISLGRRWPGGLFLLLAPLLFSIAASALRQYPFHGRLILSLVPTYHLLLAEGIAAVGRRTHVVATVLLALLFVGGQASDIGWNQFVMPKNRERPFDTHGDLKNDLLDYLDYLRRAPRRPEGEHAP